MGVTPYMVYHATCKLVISISGFRSRIHGEALVHQFAQKNQISFVTVVLNLDLSSSSWEPTPIVEQSSLLNSKCSEMNFRALSTALPIFVFVERIGITTSGLPKRYSGHSRSTIITVRPGLRIKRRRERLIWFFILLVKHPSFCWDGLSGKIMAAASSLRIRWKA